MKLIKEKKDDMQSLEFRTRKFVCLNSKTRKKNTKITSTPCEQLKRLSDAIDVNCEMCYTFHRRTAPFHQIFLRGRRKRNVGQFANIKAASKVNREINVSRVPHRL